MFSFQDYISATIHAEALDPAWQGYSRMSCPNLCQQLGKLPGKRLPIRFVGEQRLEVVMAGSVSVLRKSFVRLRGQWIRQGCILQLCWGGGLPHS